MSSSTHPIQVRPGEAVARRAAELLAQMGGERDINRERRVLVRERELRTRRVHNASRLAKLGARADAIAAYVPPSERRALKERLDRVYRGGDVGQAERTLARVERTAEEGMGRVAEQRAILEEFAGSIPGAVAVTPEDFVQDADGTLRVNTRTQAGGRVPIAFVGSDGHTHTVRLEMDESGIDCLVTDRGTVVGCEAQEEFVAKACANARARGSEVSVAGASAPPPRAAEPRRREAEQEA